MDVFAGVAVSDLPRAVEWFDRFFSGVEWFEPNETERVWTLAERCHLYIELRPEHAGHAMVTVFVEDLDGFVAAVASRGIGAQRQEVYDNGVRKAIYSDPDGNEIGVGGPPVDSAGEG